MRRLAAFCETKKTLHLVTTPVPASTIAGLARVPTPPSYQRFLATWGTFFVRYGNSPDYGNECISLFKAEPVAAAALDNNWGIAGETAIAFQRISDDCVDDFFCFDPTTDLGDGEFAVGAAYHDSPIEWHDMTFDAHLVQCIDDFIETYADED